MTRSLRWKLRRVAAGIRQQDIALRCGDEHNSVLLIAREDAGLVRNASSNVGRGQRSRGESQGNGTDNDADKRSD